jgi:hypothetical protein
MRQPVTSALNQRLEALRQQQANARAPRRGLVAALFGFLFRLLLLLIVVEIVVYWLIADSHALQGAPWGQVLHYGIWLAVGQFSGFEALDQVLWRLHGELPFVLPPALALAATLYFLPSINAARRQTPARFAVYPINLLLGWSGVGWLLALFISAASGRMPLAVRGPSRARPAQVRRSVLPSTRSSAVTVARRPTSRVGERRDPAVMRREPSRSWIRPR